MSRLPVIVGIGEIIDTPQDLAHSLEPVALMADALRRAEADAGKPVLSAIDSIDIVHQVSWRYDQTAARVCDRLGIRPTRAVYGVTGGESPMRYLHEAALRIQRGESEMAAIVGGEAQYSVNKAKSLGFDLPWTPIADHIENPFPIEGRLNAQAIAHGAIRPIHVYPFYENASHRAWGQSPREAHAESAELWSRYASVAAKNPYSWSKRAYSAEEIATVTDRNRMICFPYTKHMVANPAVNQGAAVILTTGEKARALGIDESKLIFVLGGASAMEPRDYLQRDQYERSDAQDVVLGSAKRIFERNDAELDALELYSCFPCVPKMTRRVLGLSEEVTPTVTGGLSFFGAPLNNYMTHAVCAMVRRLRSTEAETGLLYGQGEFITKHHAVAVSRHPPMRRLDDVYTVQSEVDRRRGSVPKLIDRYEGLANIETHTIIFDRDGTPLRGVVIAKAADSRVMTRISPEDRDSLSVLMNADSSPIGLQGTIALIGGELHWRF